MNGDFSVWEAVAVIAAVFALLWLLGAVLVTIVLPYWSGGAGG